MSETSPPRGAHSASRAYRTVLELGQGGTARVSLAVVGAESPARVVVVKQLLSLYARDPDFRAMFMTEGRLSARLNHPHVVRVLEVLEEPAPTILMEYIEGQTLDAVLSLAEPRLPLELHLRALADVLSGLHYSHELLDDEGSPLEVVHRDVSPPNVMVSYEGAVKVLDFGIAQLAGTSVKTQTGVVKGKLRYMPPEQVAGELVDRRADVFAVGVMLWEALSGARLWKGIPDAAILSRVLAGDIPAPRNEQRAIAPELAAICARALAPRRADRYQTALEMQQDLEGYLQAHTPPATSRELSAFMKERFSAPREELARRLAVELSRIELEEETRVPSRRGGSNVGGSTVSSRMRLLALASLLLGAVTAAWGMRSKAKAPLGPPASSSVPSHAPATPALRTPDGAATSAAAPSAAILPSNEPSALPRASTAPLPHPRAPSAVASVPLPPAEAPEVVEAACDPPYYYSSGIKKFKPECL
jgi:eukaryotic-like serine/threonine-protein kinase